MASKEIIAAELAPFAKSKLLGSSAGRASMKEVNLDAYLRRKVNPSPTMRSCDASGWLLGGSTGSVCWGVADSLHPAVVVQEDWERSLKKGAETRHQLAGIIDAPVVSKGAAGGGVKSVSKEAAGPEEGATKAKKAKKANKEGKPTKRSADRREKRGREGGAGEPVGNESASGGGGGGGEALALAALGFGAAAAEDDGGAVAKRPKPHASSASAAAGQGGEGTMALLLSALSAAGSGGEKPEKKAKKTGN